jgi:hypothetical protein
MSWGPGTTGTMKLRRKVAALVLIGTTFVCGETRRALAQDSPPDLRMLMNMDLFEPRNNGAKGAPAPASSPGDGSMLDQIRTLDAMGYLGNHGDAANGNSAPAAAAAMEAPESTPAHESAGAPPQSDVDEPVAPPQPASRPSYDVEGPQP